MDEDKKDLIPSFDAMFKPVLQALCSLGGEATLEDLDVQTIKLLNLSSALQEVPHAKMGSDHRTEVEYRLAWARTYLKKYGVIENPARGFWKLADSYNGNVERLDSKLVVQTVRQQNLEDFKKSELSISNIESASAFELFASAALQDYAKVCKKDIQFQVRRGDVVFDAEFPNGMQGDNRPVFVEIKSSLRHLGASFFEKIRRMTERLPEEASLLVVAGDVFTDVEKARRIHEMRRWAGCDVTIWDYNDLLNPATHEPDYIGYLVAPQRALVEDAITRVADGEEQKQIRKARIENLEDEYRSQNVTLFLGAGVSMSAGLPLWGTLIRRMLIAMINEKAEGEELTPQELKALNKLADENQDRSPLTQVRYISTGFEVQDYHALVRAVLYEEEVNLSSEPLNAICKMVKPERAHVGVKGVVTYNFDDLLERKLATKDIENNVVYREKDVPSASMLNIHHVHGYLPHVGGEDIDPEMKLIFSEEDYHEVYRDAFCWSNLTQLNAFRESTCLFIGCSLTDPNLRRLLDVYRRSSDTPRHYAILKREKPRNTATRKRADKKLLNLYQRIDDSIQEKYYSSIGVNVIWIDDFKEIPKILGELSRK